MNIEVYRENQNQSIFKYFSKIIPRIGETIIISGVQGVVLDVTHIIDDRGSDFSYVIVNI